MDNSEKSSQDDSAYDDLRRQKRRVAMVSFIAFAIASGLFIAIYLGFALKNCNQNINRVDYFVEGKDCFCKNSLGSNSGLWFKLMVNTDFYKQFNTFPAFLPYAVTVQYFPVQTDKNETMTIVSNTLSAFYNYYLPLLFSNKLNNVTFDIFSFNDTLGLGPAPVIGSGLENAVCGVTYKTVKFFSNNSEDCREYVLANRTNFVSTMSFSYDNELLRTYCDLQYCEVQFCDNNSLLTIILFCGSVTGLLMSLFRGFYYAGVYFANRKMEKILLLRSASNHTIKHVSYEMTRM